MSDRKTVVKHFLSGPPESGWTFLCDGSAPSDSRGMGGAYYYKGDRQTASEEAARQKAEHRRRSNGYYSQSWV